MTVPAWPITAHGTLWFCSTVTGNLLVLVPFPTLRPTSGVDMFCAKRWEQPTDKSFTHGTNIVLLRFVHIQQLHEIKNGTRVGIAIHTCFGFVSRAVLHGTYITPLAIRVWHNLERYIIKTCSFPRHKSGICFTSCDPYGMKHVYTFPRP